MNPEIRVKLAMSLMRALWGEITPDVRAVLARVVEDNRFSIEFYMDGEIAERFLEAASNVEGEVMGDFSDSYEISHEVIRFDAPTKIPVDERCVLVYLRWEPSRDEGDV